MAVVVTDSNGQTFYFKDAYRWSYDQNGNLQVEGKDATIRATFNWWESVRLEDES